ncbi:MAG: substrate-binding domain-containing protein [Desulfobacterales bacterium]|nr:substrate-binding domain-containing protein [Desulfobacterales bacterium]
MNVKCSIWICLWLLFLLAAPVSSAGDSPAGGDAGMDGERARIIRNFNEIVQAKGRRVKEGVQKRPVRISFATPLKQVSDYWRRSIDSFKGRMDEIGLSYEIKEFSTKVDENRKLKECVQSALKTDPDYLVLTPNARGDKTIISRLLSRGRPALIVQNVTIPEEEWRENPPFIYVGFDHPTGAELLAKEYIARFRDEKDVAYAMLYHVRGNQVSKLRGDTFNQIISERTDFKLVAEYYTGGVRDKSLAAALKVLDAHPDIKFIHSCSTDVSFGVLDALKARGLAGKVLVNGWGGGASELQSILAGDLGFTVMRMNDDNGVAMAEAIRLDLEGKAREKPAVFSGEMVIVRRGVGEKELAALKQRAFRYSGVQ